MTLNERPSPGGGESEAPDSGRHEAPSSPLIARNPGPSWTRWNEIPAVVLHPAYLKRTVSVAFVVGTTLFVINHLDEIADGRLSWQLWLKGAVTYLVPFFVSNWGILAACRGRRI
jgi:hypothetical protein